MVEEFSLCSVAIVSLQLVIGFLYALLRLCRWIRAARGHHTVNAEPVLLRGKLPSPNAPVPTTTAAHPALMTTAKRSSVYFGLV